MTSAFSTIPKLQEGESYALAYPLERYVAALPTSPPKEALLALVDEAPFHDGCSWCSGAHATLTTMWLLAYLSPGWDQAPVTLTAGEAELHEAANQIALLLNVDRENLAAILNADSEKRDLLVKELRTEFSTVTGPRLTVHRDPNRKASQSPCEEVPGQAFSEAIGDLAYRVPRLGH